MIVVVLDTNTLVSGFGWSGQPSVIVDAVLAGDLLLVSGASVSKTREDIPRSRWNHRARLDDFGHC